MALFLSTTYLLASTRSRPGTKPLAPKRRKSRSQGTRPCRSISFSRSNTRTSPRVRAEPLMFWLDSDTLFHGFLRSGWNHLSLLRGDPGNAILLNGVLQTANLEIGVPGVQSQVPKSTWEFRFIGVLIKVMPAGPGLDWIKDGDLQ